MATGCFCGGVVYTQAGPPTQETFEMDRYQAQRRLESN